ncbi:MAG: hypothetical protein ACI97A_004362 [Planctomycetota bacterium]
MMNPEVIPTFGLPGDMEIARQVLDDLEVSLIDAKKLIGASLPHLHPYALEKDRHFRGHFLNAIGQAMTEPLLPIMQEYVFQFERNERHKRFLSTEKFETQDMATRIGGQPLPEMVANDFAIYLASTSCRRNDGLNLTADLRQEKASGELWRQALALFGRRGIEQARVGDEVRIELIRFDRYDEYGLGVRGSKEVLGRYRIETKDLKDAVAVYRDILLSPSASQPKWLKSQ